MQLTALGVWYGFDYKLPMRREGIGRFVFYLVKSLLKNFPIVCEVWCYDCNYEEIKLLFSELMEDERYRERLKIITEKNFDAGRGLGGLSRHPAGVIKDMLLYDREGVIDWKTSYGELKASLEKDLLLNERLSLSFLNVSGLAVQRLRRFFPKGPGRPLKRVLEIKCAELPSAIGSIRGGSRAAEEDKDEAGFLAYGPYVKLLEGYYEIEVHYSASSESNEPVGFVEVSFGARKHVIRQVSLSRGSGVAKVPMWVGRELASHDLEVPVFFNGKGSLQVDKIVIKTPEGGGGLHGKLLANLANRYSKADCFYIPIIVLKNALELKKPKVMALHDLVAMEFYDLFVEQDPRFKVWIEETKEVAKGFARQGTFFCSNSDYVRRNHGLRYIPELKEEDTGYVYVPSYMPDRIVERALSRDEVASKYGIGKPYLYYPTQDRPHKNVITLLKGLRVLLDRGVDVQLVLTGALEAVPKDKEYAENSGLYPHIVFARDVPEVDLFSLYRHSAATVVPSLFEGSLPMQGLEAMFMDAPVVLARVPVTIERLQNEGFDPDGCGLKLFAPLDPSDLADKVTEVLEDRDRTVRDQMRVKEKLFSLSWDDVSRKYYRVFSERIEKMRRPGSGL